jgi:hypothetical protein
MIDLIIGGDDDRPPPTGKGNIKESVSKVLFSSRDTRDTPSMVFRNFLRTGAGTSRGCLIYSIYSNLHA